MIRIANPRMLDHFDVIYFNIVFLFIKITLSIEIYFYSSKYTFIHHNLLYLSIHI